MATIGDVLRHLVAQSDTARGGNARELYDAIDAEYPPPAPPPAPAEAEDPQAARIAELEAELAAARAGAPPGG
jgi:hypothetical protein